MPRTEPKLVAALSSLKLTLACFALLMILVVACTLAQVQLGTFLAVEKYIRSFLIWWTPEGSTVALPVFPGGGLVGGVLLLNLCMAQFLRLERSWRKAGLWIVHLGLALLFVGEFATAFFQVESRIPIEEGHTRDWSEDYRKMELAVMDTTDAADDVRAIPESLLMSKREIEHPSLPFKLVVKGYHGNAELGMRQPGDPPSVASVGIGANIKLRSLSPVTTDDAENTAAALVEPVTPEGKSYGVFLVSNALGAPQGFVHEGRSWRLALRNRRYYLPFSLTLKDFRHDVYPGTDIPKNFSSLVHLKDPANAEARDVLISMNDPLRHGGRTFYQASFGKEDTLSVLQVVRNPGWTLPYLSCLMVALGLLWHFGMSLRKSLKRPA